MNMDEQASIPLPKLHPLITLHRAPDNADGSPMWSLHNPVSNEYFRIDWISFECLARFSFYQNSRDLIHAVNQETTLSIDEQDIESLIAFLNFHGLVALPDQRFGPQSLETNKPLWMRIFHGYLFFSLPLIKPHKFLQRTLPVVRPLLSAPFVSTMLLILIAAVITTLDRSDEFFATFTQIFTPQGIVFGLLTFAVLKIVHEFAHAYTAEKYGVSVSHMGVAFIVMYPVLYTEASGSWALSSRKHRVHIGMAGILAELCIAGIALWLWNFSNPGDVLHSLSFMVVSVSLISSLLVNLNPLMRFDGYYMFSDYTRIENLQSRACAIARYRLRQILFASREDPPEMLNARQYNLMLVFGCALIIYRFFLFTGIAALVYFLFPRPLNFLMAGAELYWFIFMPAFHEVVLWQKNFRKYRQTWRTKISLLICFVLLVLMIVPWKTTISRPALLHAKIVRSFYAIDDSYIDHLPIKDGQYVEKGALLVQLSSPSLKHKQERTKRIVENLEEHRRRLSVAPSLSFQKLSALEDRLSVARQTLQDLNKQEDRLVIKAPFTGYIRDITTDLHAHRYVPADTLLFRLIAPQSHTITSYVEERQRESVRQGASARFIPTSQPLRSYKARITNISDYSEKNIESKALSSVYGGPIASTRDSSTSLQAVQSVFKLDLQPEGIGQDIENNEQIGFVHIEVPPRSFLYKLFERLALHLHEEQNHP